MSKLPFAASAETVGQEKIRRLIEFPEHQLSPLWLFDGPLYDGVIVQATYDGQTFFGRVACMQPGEMNQRDLESGERISILVFQLVEVPMRWKWFASQVNTKKVAAGDGRPVIFTRKMVKYCRLRTGIDNFLKIIFRLSRPLGSA